MKSKVLFSLLLSAVLIGTAACNSGGRKKKKSTTTTSEGGGGSTEEKVWNKAFASNVSVGGSNSVTPGGQSVLDPNSDSAMLFVVLEDEKSFRMPGQVNEYHVTYEYTYEVTVNGQAGNANDYIDSSVKTSDKTTVFFKNWPAEGSDSANYPNFKVTAKATISGESQSKDYTLVLSPFSRKYAKVELKDIYKTGTNCLDWMTDTYIPFGQEAPVAGAYGPNVDKYDEWYTKPAQSGNRPNYYSNVETYGRVTYFADEDGNTALLQCGSYSIQLYQLSDYKGWSSTKEVLFGQKDVIVRAQLSSGFGNVQLSYVDEIIPLPEGYGKTVDAITAPQPIVESEIANNNWATNPLFNKVVAPTTVTYQGNLNKISNHQKNTPTDVVPATASSADFRANRYEFDIKVGNTKVTVQTDYHMLKSSSAGNLSDTLKQIVNLQVGAEFKIGGTIRWLNERDTSKGGWGGNDYATRTLGYWEIVPYLPEHASLA